MFNAHSFFDINIDCKHAYTKWMDLPFGTDLGGEGKQIVKLPKCHCAKPVLLNNYVLKTSMKLHAHVLCPHFPQDIGQIILKNKMNKK